MISKTITILSCQQNKKKNADFTIATCKGPLNYHERCGILFFSSTSTHSLVDNVDSLKKHTRYNKKQTTKKKNKITILESGNLSYNAIKSSHKRIIIFILKGNRALKHIILSFPNNKRNRIKFIHIHIASVLKVATMHPHQEEWIKHKGIYKPKITQTHRDRLTERRRPWGQDWARSKMVSRWSDKWANVGKWLRLTRSQLRFKPRDLCDLFKLYLSSNTKRTLTHKLSIHHATTTLPLVQSTKLKGLYVSLRICGYFYYSSVSDSKTLKQNPNKLWTQILLTFLKV